MKRKRGATYRPFEKLGTLLEKDSLSPKPPAAGEREKKEPAEAGPEDEHLVFLEAMAGVEPMAREHIIVSERHAPPVGPSGGDPDGEALDRLKDLIRYGEGFVVSLTSEYIEGIGYGASPHVARRLHRGDFSIQGYLDLHGYVVEEAKEAFEGFLKEAIEEQKRAVLIIHGRGLSSRDKPVLKTKVKEWLTRGPWRKWIIAFTSARRCDGGAGATYVLLRRRPATKRYRKTDGVSPS